MENGKARGTIFRALTSKLSDLRIADSTEVGIVYCINGQFLTRSGSDQR